MKALPALVSIAFLSSAGPTLAAEGDVTDRARASFFAGVELFKEGSFAAALAEFQKAYDTSPSYRILYNIAQTYFELHDHANAYRSLGEYVKQGGDELSAARRAQVDELNRKLERRIGYLDITCNLDEADLRIDDLSVGSSPLPSAVLVNAGPHKVTAVRPGYAVASRMVTVAGGDHVELRLDLAVPTEPSPGKPMAAAPPPAPPRTAPPAIATAEPPAKKSRAGLVASLTVAGGCALASGVFAWRMLAAKSDFDREVAKTPYDRPTVEEVRSRALTYEYLTYGFAAATLAAGGVALYLGARDDGAAREPKKRAKAKPSLALAPTVNGMVVHGAW